MWRDGIHSTVRGYHDARGGYHEYRGSTILCDLSTVGDIMSTVGGVQYPWEYSNNKRSITNGTEHPTVLKIFPTCIMVSPTVLHKRYTGCYLD